ncbi:hypothetical protein TNCV_1809071 [Trichonephila clavipes]|nr:hypothetical protein TNCV_1809071 [Trichonephila clavipes]
MQKTPQCLFDLSTKKCHNPGPTHQKTASVICPSSHEDKQGQVWKVLTPAQGHTTQVTASKVLRHLKSPGSLDCRDRPGLLTTYHCLNHQSLPLKNLGPVHEEMVPPARGYHNRGTGGREITTPTCQLISGLVPRHTHLGRYPPVFSCFL